MTDRTHLTPEEMVDLVDGDLPASRSAHVSSCASCREEAAALGAVVARAAAVEAPEPSPLFWDHLSARIRAAVQEPAAAPARTLGWIRRPQALWAAGATIATVLALTYSATMPRFGAPVVPSDAPAPAAASAVSGPVDLETDDPDADEAWAVVRSVAEEVHWDEAQAAGISATPDAAERVVLEMTTVEQSELARMLGEELRQAGI